MMSFESKRVLVADDSQTMRMFLLFHLIKMLPGVKITEKLRKQGVDLILTDMNMPELDGAGLINAVRNELKRDTPIIVITTKGEQVDREKCLVLGANGYITKPLNPRELRETMLKFLWKAE
jgi:CheY-like chemotaxis protein